MPSLEVFDEQSSIGPHAKVYAYIPQASLELFRIWQAYEFVRDGIGNWLHFHARGVEPHCSEIQGRTWVLF